MKFKHVKLFFLWVLIGLSTAGLVFSASPSLRRPASLASISVPGANAIIVNPLPIGSNRLFAVVQDGRWRYPMLFDFKSGRIEKMDQLIENGRMSPINLRYASDVQGCLYLTRFAVKKPSITRFCPSTKKVTFIPLPELNTPPYSFAIDAKGFIYGALPVHRKDRQFTMVKMAPDGTLLTKKKVIADVNVNFRGQYQPLVTIIPGKLFIYWRNKVIMMDRLLNVLESYDIPGFGARRVFNVTPLKKEGTFLIHVIASQPQKASRGQVIVRDELYIWTPGGKPQRLLPASPKDLPDDARILAVAPYGFVFWAKGSVLSVSTVAGL